MTWLLLLFIKNFREVVEGYYTYAYMEESKRDMLRNPAENQSGKGHIKLPLDLATTEDEGDNRFLRKQSLQNYDILYCFR